MADPRNVIDFEGIDGAYATFIIDNSTIVYSATVAGGSAGVGLAVQMSAAGTVALTVDGSDVVGKLIKVEADNKGTVQFRGGVSLPGGNGATLTVGKSIVGAINASSAGGYIREVATATAAELGLCRGFIVDASTATATLVML